MTDPQQDDFEFRDRIVVNQISDKLTRYRSRPPKSYLELENLVRTLVQMRAHRFHGGPVEVHVPQGRKFVEKFGHRNMSVSDYVDLLVPVFGVEEVEDMITSVSQQEQQYVYEDPMLPQQALPTVQEDFGVAEEGTAAVVKL